MKNSDVAKALDSAVRYYGMKVNEFLSTNKAQFPSGQDAYRKNYKPIQDTMNIGPVQNTEIGFSQTITYGGSDAPYATAYEFGTPEYEITAKDVPMAVGKAGIMKTRGGWKPVNRTGALRSKKFRGLVEYNQEEVFLFSTVTHPAFKPRPFASVVLEQERENIVKKIGQEVLASVIRDLDKL